MSKTPLDGFFLGFKIVSCWIGYILAIVLIVASLVCGNFLMLILGGVVYISFRSLSISLLDEANRYPIDDDEDDDKDDPDFPYCTA